MSVQATRRREQSFEVFAERLTNALDEPAHKIILYGSTARGEATENSDVDILVVLDDPIIEEQRTTISTIAFEVDLEHDVAISYHLQPTTRFKSRQDSPFLKNVVRDGRVYD